MIPRGPGHCRLELAPRHRVELARRQLDGEREAVEPVEEPFDESVGDGRQLGRAADGRSGALDQEVWW